MAAAGDASTLTIHSFWPWGSSRETMSSPEQSQVGAVVLAAGKSTRMGEPKPLVELDSKPMLESTLANLRASRVYSIVLVLGFAADAVLRRIGPDAIDVVINQDYEQGMTSSLRLGLSGLDAGVNAALIVLADQPFIRPETYNKIIDEYLRSDAKIVIPMYRGFRGNPVLLDRSVFPEVMALTGDIGCRAIFGDHPDGIVKAAVDDIGILLDIDNQEDLARSQRYAQREHDRDSMLEMIELRGRSVSSTEETPSDQNHLIVVGAEPVAIALAKLAKVMQFNVTVVDPLLVPSDLPEADDVCNSLDLSKLPAGSNRYGVIASRGRFDEEAIEQALKAQIGYIALVANRQRAQEVRRRLEKNGYSADQLEALHSPAGLDIRATTPEEIALSILAQIVSWKNKTAENNF